MPAKSFFFREARLKLNKPAARAVEKTLVAAALKLGAADARIISVRTISAPDWVRRKCQFGCGGYGRCLTCPPFSPTPSETRELVRAYKRALLIHVPGDREASVRKIAPVIERMAFLAGLHRAFAMGAGPCRLCPKCNISGTCRFPDLARPSMEACGIDVFTTVRRNGFRIDVVKDTKTVPNFFGLVLLE
jgi:predicted metal-binding protein